MTSPVNTDFLSSPESRKIDKLRENLCDLRDLRGEKEIYLIFTTEHGGHGE